MPPKPPTDLGDLERDVMRLVWEHGPLAAETVRERLGRPLKESTIRTVLRRLEEKGLVAHDVEGRTFVYRAAEARSDFVARAVKRIADWFCDGAIEEVLVGMVDQKMVGADELRRLSEKIAKARAGRKPG
jgi:predicted transcriptional regulator